LRNNAFIFTAAWGDGQGIFISLEASQDCAPQWVPDSKTVPLFPSHPRLEKHKSPIHKLELSGGSAHFSRWHRHLDRLAQVSGHMTPPGHPKGCSELGETQGMVSTRIYVHRIYTQKWSSLFWLKFSGKISLTHRSGEELFNSGSHILSKATK